MSRRHTRMNQDHRRMQRHNEAQERQRKYDMLMSLEDRIAQCNERRGSSKKELHKLVVAKTMSALKAMQSPTK